MKTRIKELRARMGYTQADLAKLVGVRRETIRVRIATAFGEPVEGVFLFDEDEIELG